MTSITISGFPTNTKINDLVEVTPGGCQTLISRTFVEYLQTMKGRIGEAGEQWDRFKKYTNMYEFVHTQHPKLKTSVCQLAPLSRSFYKIIEICKQFGLLDELEKPRCEVFLLCRRAGWVHSRSSPYADES